MPIHGYPGNVITANPTAPTSTVASGVWTTEQQLLAVSQGNWPGYQYPVERSLRFNSADSAYLNRTLTTPTDGKRWTWSGWVKRGILTNGTGTAQQLFSAGSATAFFRFSTTDTLLSGWTGAANLETTQVFRDASAWYHIMLVVDTTQATASNRVKYYVNGSQITAFSSTDYPTQNSTTTINSAVAHNIGAYTSSQQYFNGYMTEVNFIDGQALTPSSFGETDSNTGVWKPKAYSGTYGTNGFYLKFADNSGTTSTTLGKDSSGNGNNWTPNNFSVTAGAGNDSLVDSPTSYGTDTGVGGEVRGNYATLNPLNLPKGGTLSNGNLDWAAPTAEGQAVGTMYVSSGKWYWEMIQNTSGGCAFGIASITTDINNINLTAGSYVYYTNGNKYNGGTGSAYGATFTNGDLIGIALDLDAGTLVFYKNGSSQGTAFTGLSGTFTALIYDGTSATAPTFTTNFGQRAFAYTAPSGFKALCTQNLPTPTIGATSTTQANDYFNTVLYTGNSSGASVTGVGFAPDFIWTKSRSNATNHELIDIVRGGSSTLFSNLTNAEATQQRISAFGSDGWTYTTNSNSANTGYTFVGWNWKANGAGSSNTAGNITSTVSVNTTSGFSIVTYTGNGSANQTVGHGLGVAPAFGILKDRDTNSNNDQWQIFHTAAGDKYGYFTTAAFAGTAEYYPTSGSSTTVTVARTGGVIATTNESGDRFVMYLFTPVAGYSAFGSFTGNGSADGPFVYLGFRPAFVMAKLSSATGDWNMVDDMRQTYNDASGNPVLRANTSSAEEDVDTMQGQMDLLSNGFKLRSNNSSLNLNNGTIIYAAFAENPFKYSLAR